MKIFIKLWLFAFAALVLAGCGDGGNNGSSTSSNGPTTFYVINTDAYDYASVKIVGSDGSTIYSGDFKCAAKTECEFGAAMDQPGKILFYNAQGAVINGYILSSTPSSLTYIKTSRRMLGIYIQGELLKRYPETLTAVGNKLNVFFTNYDSADQQPDKYEELGIYYQYRIAGGGDKLDAFYTSLHEQLENGTKLPKPLNPIASISRIFKSLFAALGSTEVISTANATASEVLCSSAAQDVVKLGAGIAGVFLPEMDPLFGAFADMGGDVCDDTGTLLKSIQDKLADIQHQLDTIQATLHVIDGKLNLLISDNVNDLINIVQSNNDDLDNRYTGSYKVLIKNTKSKTLKEYIESHGGLSKAMTQKEVKDVLDVASQWSLLDKIGAVNNKNQLVALLNGLCANPSDNPNIDIIQQREDCNKAILYYKTLVLESAGTYLNILKDITDTVQYYRDNGNAEDKKVALTMNFANGSAPDSWKTGYEQDLKPALNATLAGLTNFVTASSNVEPVTHALSKDFYYLQAGLPDDLVRNLIIAANCRSTVNGQTRANVFHWSKNAVNNGDNSSYIIVNCNDLNAKSYNSRYYYARNGNNVENILGVLVNKDYRSDEGKYMTFGDPAYYWPIVYVQATDPRYGFLLRNPPWAVYGAQNSNNFSAYEPDFKLADGASGSVRYTDAPTSLEPISYVFDLNIIFLSSGNYTSLNLYCRTKECNVFKNSYDDLGVRFDGNSGPSVHAKNGKIINGGQNVKMNGNNIDISGLAFTNGDATLVPGWVPYH
ncbi:hypothetical protein [Flavobacterium sp.]|jgi:hypothetical protein|uniref:hypothetical protein n=1 Tax=Flavobacterium sp. TaxID=239 RepID=UPI0037BF610B